MQGHIKQEPKALAYPTFVKRVLEDMRKVGAEVIEDGDHYEFVENGHVVRMLKE